MCKHYTLLEVANLIAVFGGNATAHEMCKRARCHKSGVIGNNTYQIVHTGNSDIAMDGTWIASTGLPKQVPVAYGLQLGHVVSIETAEIE